jgi:lysylphosphatidylglycerol synthetase-like protein (DUF2156 family)
MSQNGFHVNNRPLTVTITLIFIALNILVWLALGIIIAVNALPGLPDLPILKGIMAFLSLAMAGILIVLFIFLLRGSRIAYYLILALLIFTALLAIFDEVGLSDLVVLIINIIPVVLLIKDRPWYLQAKPQTKVSL